MTRRLADQAASLRTTPTPQHQAVPSTLRRAARSVLIVGTAVAVAAAFGPTWLVRVGVAIAVIAAVLACVLAWRELFSAERRHVAQQLATSRAHGEALSEERSRNGEVVDTLSRRVRDAGVVIASQNTIIGTLRSEMSTVNGDRARLRGEIERRETVITSLRETVRTQEVELLALHDERRSDEGGAPITSSVHHMPRRMLTEHDSSWAEVPDADELWTGGSHPTVVDLMMIDTAVVLPNYEVDCKVG